MFLRTVSQQNVRVSDFPSEIGALFPDQSFELSVGKVDLVLSNNKGISCLRGVHAAGCSAFNAMNETSCIKCVALHTNIFVVESAAVLLHEEGALCCFGRVNFDCIPGG